MFYLELSEKKTTLVGFCFKNWVNKKNKNYEEYDVYKVNYLAAWYGYWCV